MSIFEHTKIAKEKYEKLSVDTWQSIGEKGESFFYDFPFLADPQFIKLTRIQQRFILGYTLRDIKGFKWTELYRFASENWDMSSAISGNASIVMRKHKVIKAFLDKIDWYRIQQMGYEAKAIIEEETNLAYSDITELLDENGCITQDLKSLPKNIRRAIKSFTISEDKEGNIRYKVQLWDKGQSLSRLERINGMNKDNVNLEGSLEQNHNHTMITEDMSARDAAQIYSDMLKGQA